MPLSARGMQQQTAIMWVHILESPRDAAAEAQKTWYRGTFFCVQTREAIFNVE